MTGFFTPARMLRLALYLVLGMLAGTLLARAGDSIWLNMLPWVVLAAFWVFVIVRHRQKKPPFDVQR